METVKQYLAHVGAIIAECRAGKISYAEAGQKIKGHLPKVRIHPALQAIEYAAQDLSQGESRTTPKADWDHLVAVYQDYTHFRWPQTCWVLNITFGEYDNNKTIRTFSMFVKRQNGATIIDAALPEIKALVEKQAQSINAQQTDEWYLCNLCGLLPKSVGAYKLISAEVNEYLS